MGVAKDKAKVYGIGYNLKVIESFWNVVYIQNKTAPESIFEM